MFNFIEAKLVALTVPVLEGIPDAEGLISYAARVSNPSNQNSFDTAAKLLNYCVKHKHWSVFEMANAVFEVKIPRDIGRQILRHGSFKFQEFSQRYAEAQNFCIREARLQDTKNRQNSIVSEDMYLNQAWEEKQKELLTLVEDYYQWALNAGIAKECARVILPEGLTMSTMYINGNIRSWLHYCELRGGHGTQLEHIDLANKIQVVMEEQFPNIFLKGE